MKKRYLWIVLLWIGCTTTYKINEKAVKRILTILSSNKMGGRALHSEGIEKAANFISNEFASMGLAKFRGAKSYRQPFNMNTSSIKVSTLIINKKPLASTSYFLKLATNSILWNKENMPDIMFIKEGNNFVKTLNTAFSSDKDLLVVVSKKHKKVFSQYFSYFSEPKMSFGKKEKKDTNLVFVLSNIREVNSLEVSAFLHAEKKELTNIIGVIKGKRLNEMVVYSAHYDHLGTGTPINGDSIYNGANDDASGVAAVIELARYFKNRKKPVRTLIFVAFTAEEVGGYGSQYFSKQLNTDEIIAMLNIEMIGKKSKKGLNSAWMTGWGKSNLGKIMQNNLKEMNFKFFEDPYPNQHLFYRSDNATLAKLGVPAHSISTTQIDIDKNYHQVSDEIRTLDIANITNTINAIAIGSQEIVNGIQTPSRIDPSKLKN